jgi:hypothetical protein
MRGISMCRPRAANLWLAGFLLGQILAVGICAPQVHAQPPATETPPTKPAETPESPQPEKKPVAGPPTPASELETYLLRDSKGNLVPVIGLTFEDFEKLLKIQKGLAPPPPPPFSIDSLTVTGKADGSTAELQVAATVRVRQEGWVRVPLRFGGTALLEPAKYQGPGEHVLNVGSEGDGYLLWLKGQGKSHQVQLRLAVPVTDAGPERRLQLNLPRGTESAVRLQVPFASVAANLRNASEGILSTKSLANNQSEIVVVGPTGDLQISWQRGRASAADIKPTLDVTGEIIVRVESRNRLSSEARLKLRAVGKPLEVVTVRLPPGMQLAPAPTTGYTLTAAEGDSNKPNAGVLVDVRFERPTTGPVEIRLLAEQEVSPNMSDISLRPARFDVIGAQRQRGGVDFVVEGDWNLSWSDEGSTRRVEITDTPSATGRPVARFDYYKQPLDLKLAVTPRPTRVAVEPQYQVFVDATQLRLEAAFRFRIRGPKATSTNLDLAGWRIDSIVGENTTEQPLPPADGNPMLPLPLAQIDVAKGELTYRITAHQPLPVETASVKFSLPRPQVDTSAPASISVQPADNVELTPVVADLKGLVADTTATSPASSTIPRQHAPLLYRDLGSAEAISFVGTRRVRSRHISLQTESLVKLKRGPIEVEQRLDYQISYEGKRSYLLELPAGLAEPKALQILLGTQLLEHRPAPVIEDGPNLIEVLDTQSRLGRVQLTVRYTLPAPTLKAEPATTVHIPLITPAAGEIDRFSGQSVRVEHAEELRLTIPANGRAGDELLPSERGVLAGKTDHQLTALDLNVSLLQTPEISGLVIDRLWMQSWLSPQQRQDRSVFQFRTAAPAIIVRLPVAVADSNVQILLNGKGVTSTTSGERSVRIELPTSSTPQSNVVELWYKLRRTSSSWIADHRLTSPQLELPNSNQRLQPQRLQWQVILPPHEHLLFDPADYAPEMKWAWRNYYWSRVALYDQRWLEDWCSASRQEPLPASLNSYLYSTVGSEPELQLRTMGQRSLAISLASLGLLLGLLVLHVPQVRSATGLLILAAILLGLGFAAPQTMLFVAQVFGLGLVIVAVIAALRWLWTGQVPTPTVPLNRALSNLSGPRSTGSRSAPPMTTAAAPVLPPEPQEVES